MENNNLAQKSIKGSIGLVPKKTNQDFVLESSKESNSFNSRSTASSTSNSDVRGNLLDSFATSVPTTTTLPMTSNATLDFAQLSQAVEIKQNLVTNHFEAAISSVTERESRYPTKVFAASFIKSPNYRIVATYQQPNLVLLENFLSDLECQALIDYAKPHLSSSSVVGRETSVGNISARRTSEGMHLVDSQWQLKNTIEQRIADVVNIDAAQGEFINVLRYLPGQENRAHFDYFMPQRPSTPEYTVKNQGGQRVATFIIYLNTVAEGGETEFTLLGIKVPAIRGQALYFSYTAAGYHDMRSLHAGLPPVKGEKWVAVQFIRQSPIINKQIVGYL